jgi:hypothetical protein
MAEQQTDLEALLREVNYLADDELQHILERWPYLLPEQKTELVVLLDEMLADRGSC